VKSIDFDRVARYYDLYVQTELDLPFWVEEARRHPGRRLELMCGTGRISLAVLRAGFPLTCVDYSARLLDVFRGKLAREGLTAEVVQSDVRSLDLAGSYNFAFIGFHAVAELVEEQDRLDALCSIARVLVEGGAFSCSLHNPAVRGPQLDGRWREFPPVPIASTGGVLRWRARMDYEASTGLAQGEQVYDELDCDGRCIAHVELPVRFRLIGLEAFEATARASGFEVVRVLGDYDRSPCDPWRSPYFLYELRRRATGSSNGRPGTSASAGGSLKR
jgi:SAM-dependent methyltransferase